MISTPDWWLDENKITRAIRQDDVSRIEEAESALFQLLMSEHAAGASYQRILWLKQLHKCADKYLVRKNRSMGRDKGDTFFD